MAVEKPCPKRSPWRRFASLGAVAALAVPVAAYAASGRATPDHDAGARAVKRVLYRGYAFEVPRSWPVIDLAKRRHTCVRFDRHAVYLGRPPRNQACPSMLIGRTEALLIQPGPRSSAWSSLENPVADQITATAPMIKVTATFATRRGQVDRILASASLRAPVADAPTQPVRPPRRASACPLRSPITAASGSTRAPRQAPRT